MLGHAKFCSSMRRRESRVVRRLCTCVCFTPVRSAISQLTLSMPPKAIYTRSFVSPVSSPSHAGKKRINCCAHFYHTLEQALLNATDEAVNTRPYVFDIASHQSLVGCSLVLVRLLGSVVCVEQVLLSVSATAKEILHLHYPFQTG